MVVQAFFMKDKVFTEVSSSAKELYDKSRFGTLEKSGKVSLSILETVYLYEVKKITLFDFRGKPISLDTLTNKAVRLVPNFFTVYSVFEDLRNRGYIVKTALKFGGNFRVYSRGVKPGQGHAKWIVFPVSESEKATWYDFASKNRVAHSTRKKLLIGVVDDEGDVSYWESRWLKP